MSGRPKFVVAVVIGVALTTVAGIAIYLAVRGSPHKTQATDMVRIEVRALPVMTITKDGHELGTTPLSFSVKKSTTSIFLEARWDEKYYAPGGASKSVHKRKTQTIVADHDQTVDFTRTPLAPPGPADGGGSAPGL